MSFGQLNAKQAKAVAAAVKGRVVHDLGCGDGTLSERLMSFGAKSVFAVDAHPTPQRYCYKPGIVWIEKYFNEYHPEDIDVTFVSWPENVYREGLVDLCRRAKTLIYLGCNVDGTSCGTVPFFEMQLTRKLSVSIPDRKNSLIITSNKRCSRRTPELDELAGMNSEDIMWFDDLIKRSAA